MITPVSTISISPEQIVNHHVPIIMVAIVERPWHDSEIL